jgi:hypothetical protein
MKPGTYLLFRKGRPAYAGRSDTDVDRRAAASIRQGEYDTNYRVYPASSPRQAYLQECRLFHRHNLRDNMIHPKVPTGANWRCPVKGCDWS